MFLLPKKKRGSIFDNSPTNIHPVNVSFKVTKKKKMFYLGKKTVKFLVEKRQSVAKEKLTLTAERLMMLKTTHTHTQSTGSLFSNNNNKTGECSAGRFTNKIHDETNN